MSRHKSRIALALGVPMILSLALSGCFIGNKEVDAPGPQDAQGYYETQISPTITISATIPVTQPSSSVQMQTNFAPVDSSYVDWVISDNLTDPVYLAYNSVNGLFYLQPGVNPSPYAPPIPAMGDATDTSFGYAGSVSNFMTLMPQTHPDCVFSLQFQDSGSYDSPGPTNSIATNLPILGRIALNLDWYYQPSGSDCVYLPACYSETDTSQCSAQDQAFVVQEFGAFVNSGVLSVADLATVVQLEYQVSYQ